MTAALKPISTSALKLSATQRMGLATLLLESLADTSTVDPQLLRELNKRADDLRTGKVKGLTTKEAYGFSL